MQLRKIYLIKIIKNVGDNARKKIITHIHVTLPIFKKLNTFFYFQIFFSSLTILYYYNEKLILYINFDINKKFEFEIYIYYFLKNTLKSKKLSK